MGFSTCSCSILEISSFFACSCSILEISSFILEISSFLLVSFAYSCFILGKVFIYLFILVRFQRKRVFSTYPFLKSSLLYLFLFKWL